MDPDRLVAWIELGMRLAAAGPKKLDQVEVALQRVVEAQEQIAGYDWQIVLRAGRPTKRYSA